MSFKYDKEYSRGKRAPGPVPTRDAWDDIKRLRAAASGLEDTMANVLPDADESTTVRVAFDTIMGYAESVIIRYSRTGPPSDQSELADMEAVLRLAARNPKQFEGFDIKGLEKAAAALRKKGVT